MRKPTNIETLYIDFDAFFANVEKQLNPEIRDKPVGVTALDSEYSGFITRCYMAKTAGLSRGMQVREARAICSDLIVRVARPDVYVRVHNHILDIIDRFVPVQKVWSIDEMECRLIGSEQVGAVDLAKRIRAAIEQDIGPYVTPSIGLAPNQFLAKLGAEMNKPRGLTVLRPEDLPGPLFDLSLTDLPGISTGMEVRLHKAGISSVQDLWNIGPKHARKIWGSVEGERMWAQLHGYEIHRPETQTRMFGHSRVLTKGWNTPDKALDCLNLLTVKAAYRLRRAGYLCARLSINISAKSTNQIRSSRARWGSDIRFAACDNDPALLAHMHILCGRGAAHMGRGAALKSVSVMLSEISHPSATSGDLFDHADREYGGHNGKWSGVMKTMDALNKKHGRAVLHIGSRAGLPGGYAGGKIAFGRVPDEEDFF